MANIIDYINWRGDLDFQASPFNEIDGLILSDISYLKLHNIVPDFSSEGYITIKDAYLKMEKDNLLLSRISDPKDRLLFQKLTYSKRFANAKLFFYQESTNEEDQKQFAAVTILPEDNSMFVSFRGTDASFVGWKEDFNMTFMDQVPSQKEALIYLEKSASLIDLPIRLGGHSKGGNLAMFSGLHASENTVKRIKDIYNNDGPGFKNPVSTYKNYNLLKDKIHKILPQTSIFGILFEYDDKYTVIQSSETLIMQHDLFSWEVMGNKFVEENSLTKSSITINSALKSWISRMNSNERKEFGDLILDIFESTNTKSFTDLSDNLMSNSIIIAKKFANLNPKSKDLLIKAFSMLFSSLTDSMPSISDYFSLKYIKNKP